MARYGVSNTIECGIMAKVFLNGAEVPRCFYADTRRGVVRQFRADADGNILIDKRRKCAAVRTLRGKVEVVDMDGNPVLPAHDIRFNPQSPYRQ